MTKNDVDRWLQAYVEASYQTIAIDADIAVTTGTLSTAAAHGRALPLQVDRRSAGAF